MALAILDAIAMRECCVVLVMEICVRLCVRALYSHENGEDAIDRMCLHSNHSTLSGRLLWVSNAVLTRMRSKALRYQMSTHET